MLREAKKKSPSWWKIFYLWGSSRVPSERPTEQTRNGDGNSSRKRDCETRHQGRVKAGVERDENIFTTTWISSACLLSFARFLAFHGHGWLHDVGRWSQPWRGGNFKCVCLFDTFVIYVLFGSFAAGRHGWWRAYALACCSTWLSWVRGAGSEWSAQNLHYWEVIIDLLFSVVGCWGWAKLIFLR